MSHYERFLEYVKPEYTHILVDGRIVASGGRELYEKVDSEGYDWIYREYGIEPSYETKNNARVSIGTCAVKDTLKGDLF